MDLRNKKKNNVDRFKWKENVVEVNIREKGSD